MSGNCHYPGADHALGEYFFESTGRGHPFEYCPSCREIIRSHVRNKDRVDTALCVICMTFMGGARADKKTCSTPHRKKLFRIMRENVSP